MNELQLRILNTLKQACGDAVVRQSADARLQAHVADIGVLASHLLTELVDLPEIRVRTLKELADAAPEIERLFAEHGIDVSPARRLAQLGGSGDAAQFDACMAVALQVQLALQRIGNSAAGALEKQLALIEGDYGKRIFKAMSARTAPDLTATPVAGQTREFDRDKLSDFIARAFPEEKNLKIEDIKFISGGTSKYTMAIRLAGTRGIPSGVPGELPAELILRGDSITSAGLGGCSVIDEYRLLKIVYAHGVCAPKPLALEATGSVFDSPFMLVERRPGVMIGHMFLLPPPNRTTCRDVAAKLAAIHRAPLDSIGDWMRGAKLSTSKQVAATLEESYRNWQALDHPSPLYESAFKWLRDNVAVMDRSRGLVHGDYGLNNLLIDNERVSAILDWEFSHIGNPAYDLGYFHYMAASLGSWQEFLDAYQEAGGQKFSAEEINFSILFSVVRLGVMTCQTETAYSSGRANGIFLALAIGRHCHDQTLERLHTLLDKML